MIARSDSLTARIHEQTSRELEITFGLERGQSVLVPNREEARPERRPKSWESFRGHESGITPQDVAAQVRALYAQADNGQAFAQALEEAGYPLCRGDQRGYVILDHAGDVHSLGRRVGVKAAELKAFMQDVPLENLPSVAEARAQWRERDSEVQQQARAGDALNMPLELQAALRRRAEAIARERGDRDRDRGRER
jgi:hypothetical protein